MPTASTATVEPSTSSIVVSFAIISHTNHSVPHLFELEDLPGFPAVLRRQQVEFIGWLVHRFGIYASAVPLLQEALSRSGAAQVTDLGSGSGGPIHYLASRPGLEHVRILLTDRYPTPTAITLRNVDWHPLPVDALEPNAPGHGLLTLFNAFHHFTPVQQVQLVQLHAPRGLLVFEVLQPTVLSFLKILTTTTIGQLLLAPFVRPFRWERLLFTYILPINLVTIPWDGLVSVLRSDHPETLVERLRPSVPQGHILEGGTVGPWWAPVTWISCLPERTA
jgi:hypothetical protein